MQNGNGHATQGAVDASQNSRPGVPQKRTPAPAGKAHWAEPEKQRRVPGVLKDAQRAEFTATFGTGQPPKGLSGAMRRLAYQIPDYRIRRWLLLMLADRVDTLEWRLAGAARSPATWALGLATLGGVGLAAYTMAQTRAAPPPARRARVRHSTTSSRHVG